MLARITSHVKYSRLLFHVQPGLNFSKVILQEEKEVEMIEISYKRQEKWLEHKYKFKKNNLKIIMDYMISFLEYFIKQQQKHKSETTKSKLMYNRNVSVCLLCHTKSPGSTSVLKTLNSNSFQLNLLFWNNTKLTSTYI